MGVILAIFLALAIIVGYEILKLSRPTNAVPTGQATPGTEPVR